MKAKKFIKSNPHRPVKNLRESINYYRDTLGFYDEWIWTDNDGNETDGGIRRDNMRLLFGEDPDFVDVINSYPKSRLPIIWFVENIDEMFSEFQSKKILFSDTLRTHPYGLREFAFIEINGYYIRVAEGIDE